MEELGALMIAMPILGLAWAITVIIVTFKVWGACNNIAHITKQINAIGTDTKAANPVIVAELQRIRAAIEGRQ